MRYNTDASLADTASELKRRGIDCETVHKTDAGHFVVVNEQGPAWEDKRSMRDQKGWTEHAEFMDALEAEHFVVLGGPLRNFSKHRAVLIVNALNRSFAGGWMRTPWMPGCATNYRHLSLGHTPGKTTVGRPGSQPGKRFS